MDKLINIQRAPEVDGISEDGNPRYQRPWPVSVRQDGSVENFGHEHPLLPVQVIGFQDSLRVQHVDVPWADALNRLDEMVGKYLVTVDGDGALRVYQTAVTGIAVLGEDKPTPTIDVYCSFCGAKPGDPCRSVGNDMYSPMANRVLNEPHSNRIRKEKEKQ